MKVKDLIKQLQKMPQDAEVIYYDGDNGWCAPSPQYITEYREYVYAEKSKVVRGKFVDLTAD